MSFRGQARAMSRLLGRLADRIAVTLAREAAAQPGHADQNQL